MFGLINESEWKPLDYEVMILDKNAPVLIQGIQEYDTL